MAEPVRYITVTGAGTQGTGQTWTEQLPDNQRLVTQALQDPRAMLKRLEAGTPWNGDVERVLSLAATGKPLELRMHEGLVQNMGMRREDNGREYPNVDVSRRQYMWTRPNQDGYSTTGSRYPAENTQLAIKLLKAWLTGLDPADAKITLTYP